MGPGAAWGTVEQSNTHCCVVISYALEAFGQEHVLFAGTQMRLSSHSHVVEFSVPVL